MNASPFVSASSDYLERICKNAASWLYWIAGVTAVISTINFFGGRMIGYLGLFVPTILSGDRSYGRIESIVGLILAAVSAIVYGGLGFVASKGARWAFVVGILLYAIDTAIFAFAREWIGVALHVYALYIIFRGVGAAKQLGQIRDAERAAVAPVQPLGAWYAVPPPGVALQQPVVTEASPPADPG